MATQAVSAPPPPVVSGGTDNGQCIGADIFLFALIGFSTLIGNLESIASKWTVMMSNLEASIQALLTTQENGLKAQWNYTKIQADINAAVAAGKTIPNSDATAMGAFNSALGVVQNEDQAAVKNCDPTLTAFQNLTSALSTGLQSFVQSGGTVTNIGKVLAGLLGQL
jgi:hypothetical protein